MNTITQLNLTQEEIKIIRTSLQVAIQTGVAKGSGYEFRFINLNNKLTDILQDEVYFWDKLHEIEASEVEEEPEQYGAMITSTIEEKASIL